MDCAPGGGKRQDLTPMHVTPMHAQEDLTPEIEQEIVEEVRKVRAERRLRGAS
jgi:hypothetical protein